MARLRLGAWLNELGAGAEFLGALLTGVDRSLPRGDGSGVLLVPGLWGGDSSLFILRRNLEELGYDARTWGLGLNNRCGEETVVKLINVAGRMRERHRRPLAVIGHSRGGFMARELARRSPDLADLVITLGTPIGGTTLRDESLAIRGLLAASRALYGRRPGCMSEKCDCEYVRLLRTPRDSGAAAYSLWSRGDGVVAPENCMLPGEPNVEVPGSHVGMVANRTVLSVIARTLARHRRD